MSFSQLELLPSLLKAIDENGYKTPPTPIQQKVIPLVLDKKDVMAQAQTGSGKTASFVLPMIEEILKKIKQKEKLK